MLKSLRSESGIGLVEIIIAILVFSLGIVAALRVLPVSNVSTVRSRNITVATNLAQEKIEELMNTSFNSAALSQGTHIDPLNPLNHIFSREWTVADDVPITGMKRVDVTVSFISKSPDSTVTLSTYITSKR